MLKRRSDAIYLTEMGAFIARRIRGVYQVDAQLISISERKVIDGKNETITTPRLSFRFLNVGPAVERNLQRIIFSLEREAREKSNKVRD